MCSKFMRAKNQKQVMQSAFKYQKALVCYAYGILKDWDAAEDAVQQAFLIVLERWKEYNTEVSIFPWLRQMVYNKSCKILRARKKNMIISNEDLDEKITRSLTENFNEEEAENYIQNVSILNICISTLHNRSKQLLYAYYWENVSCELIGKQLKKSTNAVWLMLSRTRKKLRECVKKHMNQQRI